MRRGSNLYCIAVHCIELYCIVQYCIVLKGTPRTKTHSSQHSCSLYQVKKMARKQNIESNNNNNSNSNNNNNNSNGGGGGEGKKGSSKPQKRKTKEEDSDSSDCALNPSSNDSGLPSEWL